MAEKQDVDQDQERCASLSGGVSSRRRTVFAVIASWFLLLFLLARSPLVGQVLEGIASDHAKAIEHGQSLAEPHSFEKYAALAVMPVLRVFQVYPPVLTPTSNGMALSNGQAQDPMVATSGCVRSQVLMQHRFGNSYGKPFVSSYTPPLYCSFNRVTFNITVTSKGRQFDRLGVVYFGSTEIWRTSTAEPTQDGIVWTYIKDMSAYLTLFRKPQKLIFDLGNTIDDTYTAPFDATLTANFFNADETIDPADMILPVSLGKGSSGMPSAFQYPDPNKTVASSLKLPRNIRKAVFTISATGQIDEEFWFGNVLQSDVKTFGKGVVLGHSPFREVQLYIDGMLAGVVYPFPIIFTGGVVPGLWRPIVGIDAFDLREDEIDITPWLPLLCDGKSHSFDMRVAGIADDGNGHGHLSTDIGNYWVLTGKLFIWQDEKGAITTGSALQRSLPSPDVNLSSSTTKTKKGKNETLTYSVTVSREISISSQVRTSHGSVPARWSQRLSYSNHGQFTDSGNIQCTKQSTDGLDLSSSGYSRHITYPITVNTTYAMNPKTKAMTIDATLHRGQDISIAGQPILPSGLQSFEPYSKMNGQKTRQGSHLSTTQSGSAHYFSSGNNKRTMSSGSTQQDMTFTGFEVTGNPGSSFPPTSGSSELYKRHVLATNGTVVEDEERLIGHPMTTSSGTPSDDSPSMHQFADESVRKMIGHGPS